MVAPIHDKDSQESSNEEAENLFLRMIESFKKKSQDQQQDEDAEIMQFIEEKEGDYHSRLQRKRVNITKHAMQRLKERVGSFEGYRSWQDLVQTARYKGTDQNDMPDVERKWCETNLHHLRKTVRVHSLNGYAFIFKGNKGHARTLITVIKMNIGEAEGSDIRTELEQVTNDWNDN